MPTRIRYCQVRFSDEEYELVEAAAQAVGLSMASYLRMLSVTDATKAAKAATK